MGPFDMENILRARGQVSSSGVCSTPLNMYNYKPKHLSYFSAKPYEPSFVMRTNNIGKQTDFLSERHIGCKCSRAASEASSPESIHETDNNYSYDAKRKPSRSVFAPSQIGFMEGIYHGENRTYLTADNRRHISKKTGLSETQVKRWWQNRRQKDKNRLRDSLQSLNHYLPSMMYTSCEPARNYNHQYTDRALNDSLAHLTRHTQFLLQTSSNHNLVTRTS